MTRRLILQVVPFDSMYEINGSVTYYIKKQETFIMRRNFFICGLTGWCLEILFTSIGNCSRHDLRLIGQTSVWMFPIYGMAAFIGPVATLLRKCSLFFRGCFYMILIFSVEYISGSILKKHHCCPWDYSHTPYHINGVIRLDYAPLWFACGLFFEFLAKKNGSTSS